MSASFERELPMKLDLEFPLPDATFSSSCHRPTSSKSQLFNIILPRTPLESGRKTKFIHKKGKTRCKTFPEQENLRFLFGRRSCELDGGESLLKLSHFGLIAECEVAHWKWINFVDLLCFLSILFMFFRRARHLLDVCAKWSFHDIAFYSITQHACTKLGARIIILRANTCAEYDF